MLPKEEKEVFLYICDPEKNKKCTKESCYINDGPCRHTLDEKCSKIGTMPIPHHKFIEED